MTLQFPPIFDPGDVELPKAATHSRPTSPLEVIQLTHPRLVATIELLWGTPELQQYLSNLIICASTGDDAIVCESFSKDTMAALMKVYNHHTTGRQLSDIWHNAK